MFLKMFLKIASDLAKVSIESFLHLNSSHSEAVKQHHVCYQH